MSSKKVPTKRNQIEIIFKAYTDYGSYYGTFSYYAPDSLFVSSNYPESFYFDKNGFTSSFVLQFSNDGLYRVYGNLNDYELLNAEVPEGYEIESYLSSSVLYVKVVEGNAIEITEKQFRHETEKVLKEKNEERAWGRVKNELEYIFQNFEGFGIEEGEPKERTSPVENDLGLNLHTDNTDLYQKYLEEQSKIICPYPHCFRIQPCLRYRLEPSLNVPVTIQGKIEYENPLTAVCNIQTGECTYEPLKNHKVYVAVRSYVKVICIPFPPNPPYTLTTIKTIIYEFTTDFEGNISGVIYVAPPFDSGYPYVEYVQVNTERVYYTEALNEDDYKLVVDYEKTPIRYPNTLVMPAFCLLGGEIITCQNQIFDPNTNLFKFKMVFKESIEPRTFFLNWEEALKKVSIRWEQWAIGDTCYPLRAAWVSNWDQVYTEGEYDFPHGKFKCEVNYPDPQNPSYPDCSIDNLQWEQNFPNPAIYIRLWKSDPGNILIKWWKHIPYHESGHWLFYLMEGKHYYISKNVGNNDMCVNDTFASLAEPGTDKCTWGKYENTPTYQYSVNDFAEGFAEAHLFEFLFSRETAYGFYEQAYNFKEIDTKCECPIGNNCPSACQSLCAICDKSTLSNYCSSKCTLSCTDNYNSPCTTGPVSEQASLLRDIFDNVNALNYDGDGKDEVYKPIWSIFSCLKKDTNPDINYENGYSMRGFLDLFISKCGIDQNKLNNLANYFNVP